MTRSIPVILVIFLCAIGFYQCAGEANSEADKTVSEVAEVSEYSDITCPECGHTETEKLPTEVCLLRYDCTKCGTEMTPGSSLAV